MTSKVLMFSISLNGYDKMWERCILSQRRYAEKNNYDYCLINKIDRELTGDQSSWLKIPLIMRALKNGYDWVLFVDSDCYISELAPKVETLGKFIYMALGHSKRVNAGVMIIKNSILSRLFFSRIFISSDWPIPNKAEQAPYENGHVIHFFNRASIAQIVDQRWNNASEPLLKDYIRHYTGPMRKLYPFGDIKTRTIKNDKSYNLFSLVVRPKYRLLKEVAKKCVKIYPFFG